jgi:N6-adenosine-specific RNA methylase IME4/ParB-like chromosome segregation protein Spo0J
MTHATLAVKSPYQLLDPLRPEELAALEADVLKRGILVPIETDEDGNTLDGHHRLALAEKHGLPYETIVRRFASEQAKREHAIRLNLIRRHLDPVRWGRAFSLILAERGVKAGRGTRNDIQTSATIAEVASELGVPERTARHRVAQAKLYDALPAQVRGEVDDGGMTLVQAKRYLTEQRREARRENNRAVVAAAAPLEQAVVGKFATIVMDPPWDYRSDEQDGDPFGRGLPTYATLTIEEIRALPIGERADVDCHLYLWITNRSLPKGFDLLERWGFRYVTCLTWCKPSFGMGNYFRGQTEHVLFGVKGSQALRRNDIGTWFAADRGSDGHSSKPPEFLHLVESCSPGPYLEVFSRRQRKGWTAWGGDLPQAEVAS